MSPDSTTPPAARPTPVLDVDAHLDDARIVVCCGSGGVGKTTTAAALALRAAERGRNVVVLTIDPARRLAQAMGLSELDNTPRRVVEVATGPENKAAVPSRPPENKAAVPSRPPENTAPEPSRPSENAGELWAMMLDMKRTFDDIVLTHASRERAEALLANPFYQSLSSSFAGTQEYMAMEKLGQLQATENWDLIVVDTPPTRSALDFLDAPQRLGAFLDGRLLRLLLVPAKAGGRAYVKVLGAGFSIMTRALTRVIGTQLLTDVSQFVAALETMFGGFRQRAEETYRLLAAPGTAFFVVAAPEPDALREASYFVDRLGDEQMPLAGLVLNRVHHSRAATLSAPRSLSGAEILAERGEFPLAAAVLRLHADRMQLATREHLLRERFTMAHPEVPVAEVPALAGDVHDLDGLRYVGEQLARGLDDPAADGAA